MRISLALVGVFTTVSLLAQDFSYKRHEIINVPKFHEVNFGRHQDPFMVHIEPVEAPDVIPSKEKAFLMEQKARAQQLFPKTTPAARRSSLAPPELVNDFSGNNWLTSTPLDNHIAFSRDEQILSTVNVHMVVMNESGFWLGNRTLSTLFAPITNVDRFFDPRVMYDPVENRWVMALMNGSDCGDSELLFAFSKSADATGAWNIYKIPGCPFNDMTFADYPMISLIGDELFYTYNAVATGEPWETGFVETFIWQIDKLGGYAGDTLKARMWTGLNFGGRNIRNLCPVKNATEELPTEAFFLSNRNFDIQNDSIFIVEVNGDLSTPGAEMLIDVRTADQPYGVPPHALQPEDTLQTNDARILDAFLLDDHIQFVGNTMDFESGKASVYHGVIENIRSDRQISARIINGGEDELGYPGIAYTGVLPGERDAVIIASHVSETRNPGFSACYVDGYGEWSPWITVKEGQKPIDMLTRGLERWGDYCGAQRVYDRPGYVYASASYGRYDGSNNTWIGYLARPEMSVSTDNPGKEKEIGLDAYPNPSHTWFDLRFEVERPMELDIVLVSMAGKFRKTLRREKVNAGTHVLHFNLFSVPAGPYLVQILDDGRLVATEKVIRQ